MAQSSWPWTDATGDGGPYAANTWDDDAEILFTTDMAATEGVVKGYLNELVVAGTATPCTVGTGAAVVKGKRYKNTASVDVAIPTPSSSTRIDCIVLEADYTGQTVRIARVAGEEGGAAPAMTQVDGTTWQIKLAEASITTGGVITVTDSRAYCHYGGMVAASQIDNRTRAFFVPVSACYNAGDELAVPRTESRGWPTTDAKSITCYGEFYCPSDYASGMTISSVVVSAAAANVYWTSKADYCAATEAMGTHSDSVAAAAVAVLATPAVTVIQPITITAIAAGDYVTITIVRAADNELDTVNGIVYLKGWLVSYTADS